MCTVVLLRRPDAPWPLLLAANRDEMEGRPWLPPARHWDDRPDITAGQDQLAGGTWLAVNDRGMVAGVLNRPGSLGPTKGKRSRGELPLDALDHESAEAAAHALKHLDPIAYRPFNLLIADAARAFCLVAREGATRMQVVEIGVGLSMLSAHDLNDAQNSLRVRHFRPQFAAATVPDPDTNDWADWKNLLASRATAPQAGPEGAMNIRMENGFGTRSSSLIALPRPQFPPRLPIWHFCHGAPDTGRWSNIEFEQETT